MSMSYSIAEARDQLSRVVHQAEVLGAVELKRRGRTVAVVVSAAEYERLTADRKPVSQVVQEIRTRYRVDELGINPEDMLAGSRDDSRGRGFEW
jgi:prevent-host-death family protein